MAKKRKSSLFHKPKTKKYSEIVKFNNIKIANESAIKLRKEFDEAKTNAKRLRVLRVAVNSSNSAYASSKRKNLSSQEKTKLKKIGNIFKKLYNELSNKYKAQKK